MGPMVQNVVTLLLAPRVVGSIFASILGVICVFICVFIIFIRIAIKKVSKLITSIKLSIIGINDCVCIHIFVYKDIDIYLRKGLTVNIDN